MKTEIVIHHSGELDTPLYEWPAIRRYQMSFRINHVIVTQTEYFRRLLAGEVGYFESPWLDIGYHGGVEVIAGVPVLQMGRPWDWEGAHTLGHNNEALGFCFVGDYSIAPPSDETLATGVRMLSLWMRLFSIPKDKIFAHRDLNITACPGAAFDMARLLAML